MSEISNINDLRGFLAEELSKVASGERTPASANAAANIAGKIISSIKMELEYNKMLGATPHIDFIKSRKDEIKKLDVTNSIEIKD